MKISKIACVALLGASFAVSSAFATPQTDYDTAVSNKENAIKANSADQKTKAEAYNKVMAQVKVLQGIEELKDWDGTATNTDPEKAKTFKKISDAVAAIKDELDKIKPASGSLELVAADKTSKLTIDNAGAVKVNIDGNGGKQEATGEVTLDFATPTTNAADIAKIFSDKNANVWNEFVKAFADKHAELVKERDEKLADDIKTTLDPAIQTAAVALATVETTAPTYEGTVKNYDALNDALKKDVAAKEKVKADKDKELATAVKDLQTGADKDKVALKGTDATSIAKQADAVTAAKTELTTAATGSDDDKKTALKKAIEAGVPVESAGKKLSAADVDKLETGDLGTVTTAAAAAATTAETAMATVKTDAAAVKAQDTIIETSTKAIADQKAKVKEISNTRAKAIATSENLDKGESDVLTALSDIFDSNARVESIIADESANDVADGVSELHSTLDTATKSLNKGNFTDIVIFNTNLATNTRLAKLSNPYNGNLALAYAVKNMAGEKFADNGSDALSSVVKEYTNRYNYDNNLWGNVFGGKAKVKDAANTDVYGFTLGYDKAFDNTIVGGFFTLAKAQSDGNNVKNDADNYSFGVYTRSYFGQNELDSKFAYGFAKNTLKTKSSPIGDNEGKYDSKYFDIALDYGYVFDIGNAKFVKPIFGLEYTNLKNDSFTAGGPVDLNFAKTSVKTLNAKLGAEFRAYTEKGDYFYVTPGIERELSKSADDSVLNFAGSRNVTFDADKRKYTYATLKTGAEFKITDSLSTNINFGVKARSKNQFYNGTLGLSYKF
ncbi:autotransporter domain-containing protein [Campylobacter concisus]|uniref:autotransporter domain-containing protein n=1 Tax=Campylobacter concisus TaxID=199 RepID=UPI0011E6FCFC|nr:autotransporter domain-containing protein [Campylobacter concisus]